MRYRNLIAGLCLMGSLGCEAEERNKPEGPTKDLVRGTYKVSLSGKYAKLEIYSLSLYCNLHFNPSPSEFLLIHDLDCDGTTDQV